MQVQTHREPATPITRLAAPATPPPGDNAPPKDEVKLDNGPAPLAKRPSFEPEEPSKFKSFLGKAGVIATSAAAGIGAGMVGAMGGAIGATAGAAAGVVLGVSAAIGVGAAAIMAIAKESPLLALALVVAAPVTVAIFSPLLWAGGAAGMAAVGAIGAAGGPTAALLVGAGGAIAGAALASGVKGAFQ